MKTFIILIPVLCFSCLVHAQTLKQAEYFIDKDKGFGKNNKLNLASSADSSYQFKINLSGISIGNTNFISAQKIIRASGVRQ